MHLRRPGVEEHLDDLPRRRAAHDRVVDDHEPLPRHLGERVELHPDPLVAHALLGLDERAMHVAVLDQALAERDPGRPREADRGRRARVRDRQDEIGLRRRLGGELHAHAHPRPVHLDPLEPRVRPGQVEDTRRCRASRVRPRSAPAATGGRRCRRRRARRGGSRARTRRRPDRGRRSRRRARGRRRGSRGRAAGSRAGRGTRTAPRRRARPPSRPLRASPSRPRSPPRAALGAPEIIAAITSLSELDPSRAASSWRSGSALIRLPLCPSATVRTAPWCSTGCAFAQAFEPVVE